MALWHWFPGALWHMFVAVALWFLFSVARWHLFPAVMVAKWTVLQEGAARGHVSLLRDLLLFNGTPPGRSKAEYV